jgi:uncharacterized membrane protein
VTKNRLENCSEGVFSKASTLLVLDVKLPEVNMLGLAHALIESPPRVVAYVIYWL